ncbi:MAG TPA: LPS export ABC transporter periplasmic protein LptC [Burkholderiales bacterium]|jgi:lipopolysaccharide export system protein LptC|nr:LPS export ABC transporter periplasmic protein LptC [Burkholderiales bacterium]
MSTTRLFPLGLMLSLALLTFYLERTVREDDSPPALRRHDPDYLVTNFTTTTYNRDGAAETVMSAAQMVHYPDDDTTELFSPRVVQAKPNEPRLTVRAERGQLSRDGDEIFLYGSVLLVREATPEKPEARMTTEFLHILRERSLVRSDRPVKFVEGGRSLTGRGMEYNNESRELLLRHDVQARFEAE